MKRVAGVVTRLGSRQRGVAAETSYPTRGGLTSGRARAKPLSPKRSSCCCREPSGQVAPRQFAEPGVVEVPAEAVADELEELVVGGVSRRTGVVDVELVGIQPGRCDSVRPSGPRTAARAYARDDDAHAPGYRHRCARLRIYYQPARIGLASLRGSARCVSARSRHVDSRALALIGTRGPRFSALGRAPWLR